MFFGGLSGFTVASDTGDILSLQKTPTTFDSDVISDIVV